MEEPTESTVCAQFSVGVVSYRTGAILADCLDHLGREADVGEIWVVDNGNPGSVHGMLEAMAAREPRLKVLRPGRNLGYAAACNLVAQRATGRYIAFVNPDLIVPGGTFAKVAAAFAQGDDIWLCGGRLLNMDGSEQRGGRREVLTPWRAFVEMVRLDRLAPTHPHFRRFHLMDGTPPDTVVAVPTVSGAFMAMPRDRFLGLGGMDEAMFLHMEDVDLCLRVLLAGGRVLYCGNVPLYHQRSSSDVSRCFVEWHKTRSTIHYFHKHFRSTYPAWSLHLMTGLLMLRAGVVAAGALPADVGRLLRRARG